MNFNLTVLRAFWYPDPRQNVERRRYGLFSPGGEVRGFQYPFELWVVAEPVDGVIRLN
jgi:hypothetical protein